MTFEGLLRNKDWQHAERLLAKRFHLDFFPASGLHLKLLRAETAISGFSLEDVLAVFEREPDEIVEFAERWYADCHDRNYGEEWDPHEGNQQDEGQKTKTFGISEGFLVSYVMFYLYAKERPQELAAYVKRRRIPHAKKVAKDVVRVYQAMRQSQASKSS